MLLALSMSVLIGCASNKDLIQQIDGNALRPYQEGTATLILSAVPSLPIVPKFPLSMDWGYDENLMLYTLPERDVDRLLDYRDNLIPMYLAQMNLYEEELLSIIDRISGMNL